jgi:hypothetical protein
MCTAGSKFLNAIPLTVIVARCGIADVGAKNSALWQVRHYDVV